MIAVAGLALGLATGSDAVFLVALIAGGLPLVAKTLAGMLRARFAADVVAMLAILTALALGQYFVGTVIVLMQSGGEALEAYAMGRESRSLEALLARAPKIAHRQRGDAIDDVPVDAVQVGDLLVLRPGDLVPVDGSVTERLLNDLPTSLLVAPVGVRVGAPEETPAWTGGKVVTV